MIKSKKEKKIKILLNRFHKIEKRNKIKLKVLINGKIC